MRTSVLFLPNTANLDRKVHFQRKQRWPAPPLGGVGLVLFLRPRWRRLGERPWFGAPFFIAPRQGPECKDTGSNHLGTRGFAELRPILMAIYTPRGMEIRLPVGYALALMTRLHPEVDPFDVLTTAEGIDQINSLLAVCTTRHPGSGGGSNQRAAPSARQIRAD